MPSLSELLNAELADGGGYTPPPEPVSSGPSLGDTLWDAGGSVLSGISTALDSFARPVRTALHTRDLGQALEAVVDPSKASTTEDLLGDVGYETTAPGEDRSWGTAIADTLANVAVGAATDPLTYISFGATGLGEQALSKGASAVSLLRAGKNAEALAMVGGNAERLAAGGVLPKLSQRLAAGETAMKVAGLPVLGKSIAPAVAAGEHLVGIAGSALEGTSPGAYKFMKAVGNFFAESTGKRGLDILAQQTAAKGFNFAEDAAKEIGHSMQKLRDAGVREEDMNLVTDLIQTHSSAEHLEKVVKSSGKSLEEVAGIRGQRAALDPESVYAQLRAKGYNQQQIEAVAQTADAFAGKYKQLVDIEKELKIKDVTDLGAGSLSNLAEKRAALVGYLEQNGVPANLLHGPEGAAKDITKVFELDPRLKAGVGGDLLQDYEQALKIAAQVPGYTPMRISREAADVILEAARNDPGIMRKMSDITGVLATKAEAQKIVEMFGSAAAGGRTIPGKISMAALNKAYMAGWNADGLDGAAKAVAEAVSKGGKMFEEHPGVVFSDRLKVTAQALGQDDYVRGLRGMLGRDMPEEISALRKQIETGEAELRALQESKNSVVAKQGLLPGFAEEAATGIERPYALGSVSYQGGGLPYDQPGLFGDKYQGYGGRGAAQARAGEKLGQASEGLFGQTVHGPGEKGALEARRTAKLNPQTDLFGNTVYGEGPLAAQGKASLSQAEKYPPHLYNPLDIPPSTMHADIPKPGSATFYDERAGISKASGSHMADKAIERKIADAEVNLSRLRDKLDKANLRVSGNIPVNWERASQVWPHLKDTPNDFLLPAETLELVTRQRQMMADPKTYAPLVSAIRDFNSNWKALTLAAPSTIIRNKIGNLFLRATHGGLDGISVMEQAPILNLQRIIAKAEPDMAQQAAKIVFDVGGGKTMDGWSLFQKARELGAIDSGMWATEFRNPIREGLKKGGLISKVTEPLKNVAQTVENGDKFGHFLARLRAGDSAEQAAWSASQALFNYRVVSPAVQMLRSTGLAPFAAWSAKNIPAQMSLLFHKPGYFAAMLHAKNAIEQGVPGYTEQELPGYLRDKFNVAYKRNKDGSVDFISAEGLIPMADLPKVADPGQFFSDLVGPLPKTGMEWLFNKDLFTKRNIKEFDAQVKPLFGLDVPVSPMTEKALENLVPRASTIVAGVKYARGEYKGQTTSIPGTGVELPRQAASFFLPINPQTTNGRQAIERDVRALRSQLGQIQKAARDNAQNPRLAQHYQAQAAQVQQRLSRLQGNRALRPVP